MSRMISSNNLKKIRCAIYTRKSTEEGLEQEFNSLDAQRESAEAFITSQQHEGWVCLPDRYDDGGYTGGNMDRPALKRLMTDIKAGKVDCVVVYKVDRLSRSLLDFARIVETFEKHNISFVSVTQQFNTTHSMGRLTLNILLSFAQFEREIISERTRDKIAATRRKGKWSGGMPILGYDVDKQGMKLKVNEFEASRVRTIFKLYLEHQALLPTVAELERRKWKTKRWTTRKGKDRGGRQFDKCKLYSLLTNVTYLGKTRYKEEIHEGEHAAIIDPEIWQQVQTMLVRNGRLGGSGVRNKSGALLKGLLRCTACNCSMSPTHSTRGNKRYRYYLCLNAQKRGWQNCPTRSVPAGEIEKFVINQIKCIGLDQELIAETLRQSQSQTEVRLRQLALESTQLERELLGLHREIQLLLKETGGIPTGLGTTRLADLQEQIRAAEHRLTESREEIISLEKGKIDEHEVKQGLADFDQIWNLLSLREQERLLKLIIERVDYDGRDETITLSFHPNGIKTLVEQVQQGGAA